MYKKALFSSLSNQIWPHLLFSKYSLTTSSFGGHIGFLKKTVISWMFYISFITSAYFRSKEVICYHIKLFVSTFASLTSGFGVDFEFFYFNIFFYQNLLAKCVYDAYSSSKEVKTYKMDYFTWNNSLFAKILFLRQFFIFDPIFLQEFGKVESWVTIPNLVMRNDTYIPNLKKIRF